MKKTFEFAEIEVVVFGEAQVLTASGTGADTGFAPEITTEADDLPIAPAI